MAFIQNAAAPASGGGTGDVTGTPPSDDKAIARYSGTTGKIIQNSPGTLVQDGGAIQAQAFVTDRVISALVAIPPNYSMLAPNIEIEDGELNIEQDGELLIL